MKIIGLLGKAGSGKSTAAKYLEARYGAVIFSLATPLKAIAKDVFNFSDEQLYGSQEMKDAVDSRYNFSPRWLLQKLGTEGIRRHLGEDIWTQAVLRAIENAAPRIAVIEDVRFINECRFISACYNGYVVKLVCTDTYEATNSSHPSESEVNLVPEHFIETIINSHRTPDSVDLKAKISSLMETVFNIMPYPITSIVGTVLP